MTPLRAVAVLAGLLMAVGPACDGSKAGKSGDTSEKKAPSRSATSAKPAATPTVTRAAARTRIEELLDVPSALPPEGGVLPFDSGAEMRFPKGFVPQGAGDITSALDTLTAAEQRAHCYMTARLLGSGDPLSGVTLWASSAGGRPASFTGPEPIVLGPDKVPAKLFWGKDGVKLGDPGGGAQGITIAIVPDKNLKLLVVGVARKEASTELRQKLAGCLQSFRLK